MACPVLILTEPSGVERVLIGDERGEVRLDVRAGTVLDGPVRLRYDLAGARGVEAKLLTLCRLMALMRLGRIPRRLFLSSRRTGRWAMALQALDARRAGASHRDIAAALFGEEIVAQDWDGRSTYLRSRVQRLLRLGEALRQGGYRRLLR
ncbi:DUF2285 domain-containing protein [Inquilinus limosus]